MKFFNILIFLLMGTSLVAMELSQPSKKRKISEKASQDVQAISGLLQCKKNLCGCGNAVYFNNTDFGKRHLKYKCFTSQEERDKAYALVCDVCGVRCQRLSGLNRHVNKQDDQNNKASVHAVLRKFQSEFNDQLEDSEFHNELKEIVEEAWKALKLNQTLKTDTKEVS